MNKMKCHECRFFDLITNARVPNPSHGWCAKRSEYPAKEGPGQVFPEGVKRVEDADAPAKPYIIHRNAVISQCTMAERK